MPFIIWHFIYLVFVLLKNPWCIAKTKPVYLSFRRSSNTLVLVSWHVELWVKSWRQSYLGPWEFHYLASAWSVLEAVAVGSLNQWGWKYTENDLFYFISFFFFLCCQGMAHVFSLSLLLACKGISKPLWQMLPLSSLSLAWLQILACAQTWTYRSRIRQPREWHTDSECPPRSYFFQLEQRMTLFLCSSPIQHLKKIDSSWTPLGRSIQRKGNWQL